MLRNGRLVGTATAAELPRLKLISMMLGRELQQTEERLEASPMASEAEPILIAEGLGRRRVMAPFDLSLKAGEVVGLAGLWDRDERKSPSSYSARSSPIPDASKSPRPSARAFAGDR